MPLRYKAMALKYQPDKNQGAGRAEAAQKFRTVSDAEGSSFKKIGIVGLANVPQI